MKKFVLLMVLVSVILVTSEIVFCAEANIPVPPQQVNKTVIPDDPNYVILTFDGKDLTLGKAKYFTPDLNYETLNNIADFYINTQLLYEEAVKKGVDKDEKTKFLADISYKKAFVSAMIEKLQKDVNVTDEDAQKYYDKNKDTDPRLKEPTYLSFSHITVETEEQAKDIRKKIEAGEDLNALAKQSSIASDAKKGGRAAKFREETIRSRLGNEILDAMLKANEGTLIGPIKNKDGKYEIIRHEGKRLSHIFEFEKVKDQIKASLENEAKKNAVENLLNKLKDDAKNRYKKVGILSDAQNTEQTVEKTDEPVKKSAEKKKKSHK